VRDSSFVPASGTSTAVTRRILNGESVNKHPSERRFTLPGTNNGAEKRDMIEGEIKVVSLQRHSFCLTFKFVDYVPK